MDAGTLLILAENAFPIIFGIFLTLYGYRKLGPTPKSNLYYEAWYKQWGRHFKWGGPLVITAGVIQTILRAIFNAW